MLGADWMRKQSHDVSCGCVIVAITTGACDNVNKPFLSFTCINQMLRLSASVWPLTNQYIAQGVSMLHSASSCIARLEISIHIYS